MVNGSGIREERHLLCEISNCHLHIRPRSCFTSNFTLRFGLSIGHIVYFIVYRRSLIFTLIVPQRSTSLVFPLQHTSYSTETGAHAYILLHFIHFVTRYPFLTMLCQSLASMVVALECLWLLAPDILCDTTGAPFIYPIAKYIGRCTVLAYIHYPIISSVCCFGYYV